MQHGSAERSQSQDRNLGDVSLRSSTASRVNFVYISFRDSVNSLVHLIGGARMSSAVAPPKADEGTSGHYPALWMLLPRHYMTSNVM